jgi:hypothetical protein
MYNQIGKRDSLTKEQRDYRNNYGKIPTPDEMKQIIEYRHSKHRLVEMTRHTKIILIDAIVS